LNAGLQKISGGLREWTADVAWRDEALDANPTPNRRTPMSERELFIAAIQKATDDRPAFLDQACPGDPDLRRRVEILLEAHEMAGGLLDLSGQSRPTADGMNATTATPVDATFDQEPATNLTDTGAQRPITEGPGTRIVPYKLLQEIGEGGMGTVYMAEQEHPVRRRVALKIIKPGMDSAQVIARFEAERQALALMDHPNIAKVLDAGTTDSGRPYFVMELVNGIPITQYSDEARLNPRERLELFVPVCQAIQHAHQKGVIHRDIKPSNVLVTRYDGKPVPKVIDFGIAKATAQRLTEKTMFTQFGSIVGTLEYMSPEQAEMSALGVDTRSDIYSLGVLLYELLTGTTPLERAQVREAAYVEILRRIKEEETPKPSTRLSASKETLPSISAQRRTDPARLARVVRGDLDWIVMKSLEKDRARRYESASGFARDVQRHLDGDAVEACPPSAGYRLRKFARKHRAALTITSAFAAMLLLAVVVTTWQAILATRARQKAVHEAVRAREAEEQARHQEEQASRSAAEAQAVLKFFEDQLLAAARPEGQWGGLGKDVTIRKAVEAAEPKIAAAFKDQPTVEAAVRETLGQSYYYLGEAEKAIREHERAAVLLKTQLGPDHPGTFQSCNSLAKAYLSAGRTAEAITLIEATLKAQESKLGPDHPDTLVSCNNLATAYRSAGRTAEAISLMEATLKAWETKFEPDHPDLLISRNNLAEAYRSVGRAAAAIPLHEATLKVWVTKFGPDYPEVLISRNNLAIAFLSAGRAAEAIPLLEATLKAQESKLGSDHPNTFASRNNLAQAYLAAGRTTEAISLLEATLKARESKLGPDHPETCQSRHNLAAAYFNTGRTAEAIPLLEATLKARETKLGLDHPDMLQSRRSLALAYDRAGQTTRAITLLESLVAAQKAKFGTDHPDTLQSRSNLAAAYFNTGRTAEAIPLLEATLKAQESNPGADHPDTLQSRKNLALTYQQVGQTARAITLLQNTVEAMRAKLGADHPETLTVENSLGWAFQEQGEVARAEAIYHDVLTRRKAKIGTDDADFATVLACLGSCLLKQEKWGEAEAVLRECIRIRESKVTDDWTRFDTSSELGGCLLGQKKYAAAEPLIVSGYEGMRSREVKIPWQSKPRLAAAAERVVKLYEAWGKPDKAAAWREKLKVPKAEAKSESW
jgi:serine/threonine protein kinase/tetratricopeptide (TPR) repeat protein